MADIAKLVVASSIALDVLMACCAIVGVAWSVRWITFPSNRQASDPRIRLFIHLTLVLVFASYAMIIVGASLHLYCDVNYTCGPVPSWP